MAEEMPRYPYHVDGEVLTLFINPRLISPRAVFGVVSVLSGDYLFIVDGSPDGVIKLYVKRKDGNAPDETDAWYIYTELLHQMAVELRATDTANVIGRLVSPGPASHSSSVPGGQGR